MERGILSMIAPLAEPHIRPGIVHVTKAKIGHLSNAKIIQMRDVFGRAMPYTESALHAGRSP
jgi:hypothetical protein